MYKLGCSKKLLEFAKPTDQKVAGQIQPEKMAANQHQYHHACCEHSSLLSQGRTQGNHLRARNQMPKHLSSLGRPASAQCYVRTSGKFCSTPFGSCPWLFCPICETLLAISQKASSLTFSCQLVSFPLVAQASSCPSLLLPSVDPLM
mmetsp:Transcript_12884/g.21356  ORF Transcript_12884/g.21356 Transcript_12884/m.21356 type:complete len:147 (+) Transcript_12884:328-768(+)